MSHERFSSVWDALEETPQDAQTMKIRAALMRTLMDHVSEAGLAPEAASRLLGVTPSRLADLMAGRIDLFSLEALVTMAGAAGLRVEMTVATPDQAA